MMTTKNNPTSKMSAADALWVLIQSQTVAVRKTLIKRLMEQQQESAVEVNLDKEDFFRRIKALDGDPLGFFKLGGILGKPNPGFSWDKLRDEAYVEKYAL